MSSDKDALLLLNMTDHLIHISRYQQDSFFGIINDISDNTRSIDCGVKVPLNTNDANSILSDDKYGLFANLPYENIVIKGGHACISLVGLFKH